MDVWIFHDILNHEIGEMNEQNRLRINQRHLRNASDPFNIPEVKFKNLFRLTPQLALDFFTRLNPLLEEPVRSTGIPNHLKFLVTLYFYAQGSYQSDIGLNYNFAFSQPSVSRTIQNVSRCISNEFLNEYIKFPTEDHEIENAKQRFQEFFNFPNVLGCIDGTHIAIIQPPEMNPIRPGIAYLNRKNFHSVNTQIICDANMKILGINARFPGSVHDSAIWQMSNIRRHLEEKYFKGHQNTFLLGDLGYPLQPWLMTPILGALADSPEGRYTKGHCRTRNIIERCIGVLKSRFRCLLKHRTLHYSPVAAAHIIYSCAVLHNICVNANLHYDGEIYENLDDVMDYEIENNLEPNLLARARQIQGHLVQYFE